ncbi:hypothetical protein [Leptolyngbya sp. PCC 6406]|uniref:hypothetical protein n=1 Tax=Leptolyngbya sp. PCC 6406 TaxID=1173264 RepID=UPI0002F9C7B7|nr:hypothetical protein [Leptolyngbya sp. PCC 6406]
MTLSFVAVCTTSTAALVAYSSLIHIAPELPCDRLMGRWISDRTRFSCAQEVASGGQLPDLAAALEIIADWSPSHPLFGEMRPLLSQWSSPLLRAAQTRAAQADLDGALALGFQIPPISPDYGTAQHQIEIWQQLRYAQVHIPYAQAQTALQQQDWAGAFQARQAMESLEGQVWQTGLVPRLTHQIELERRASKTWTEASHLAFLGGDDNLGSAIALGSTVPPDAYLWQSAQVQLDAWSDELLDRALEYWYAGELNRALQLAEQVRQYPGRVEAAQDLIWLCQARQLALASLREEGQSTTARAVGLYPALLVAQQISPESDLHPQSIATATTWRGHLQEPTAPLVSSEVSPPDRNNAATLSNAVLKEHPEPSPEGNPAVAEDASSDSRVSSRVNSSPSPDREAALETSPSFNPDPFIAPKVPLPFAPESGLYGPLRLRIPQFSKTDKDSLDPNPFRSDSFTTSP